MRLILTTDGPLGTAGALIDISPVTARILVARGDARPADGRGALLGVKLREPAVVPVRPRPCWPTRRVASPPRKRLIGTREAVCA